jgi:hypothetical protein
VSAGADPAPWLANAQWRQRELRYVHGIGVAVFALVALLSGLIAFTWLSYLWANRPLPGPDGFVEGIAAWSALLLLGLLLLAPAVWAAFGLRRRIRFGESVCRLLTLPGVVGGWFKADVECRLPGEAHAKVEVWLINRLLNSNDVRHVHDGRPERAGLWRMSQSMDVEVAPGARTVIPVRLKVPRDPKQFYRLPDGRPNSPASHFWDDKPAWLLVVRNRGAGTNFMAMFSVPVFDTSDAPASEQGAD